MITPNNQGERRGFAFSPKEACLIQIIGSLLGSPEDATGDPLQLLLGILSPPLVRVLADRNHQRGGSTRQREVLMACNYTLQGLKFGIKVRIFILTEAAYKITGSGVNRSRSGAHE
jgi:hypothetical protein